MGLLLRYSQGRADVIEALFVLLVLSAVAFASGARTADMLSALAGFLTFLCTQNAFEMNERLRGEQAASGPVEHRYRNLFVLKEGVWVVTFVVLGSYPLLASTGVFASYPWWRNKLRSFEASPPC